MSQATKSSRKEDNRYFNQYASGLGYLNSIRNFGTTQKPRWSAQISVLQGPSDQVHYEYHDLVVTTEQALQVIHDHQDAIENDEAKVLIRFKMANPRANAFQYKQGDRAGEWSACIGGLLTRVLSLKVDGEQVYEDSPTGDAVETEQAANG